MPMLVVFFTCHGTTVLPTYLPPLLLPPPLLTSTIYLLCGDSQNATVRDLLSASHMHARVGSKNLFRLLS